MEIFRRKTRLIVDKLCTVRFQLASILGCILLLSACGDVEPQQPDASRGKALFNQAHIGKSLGCITCHSFSTEVKTVGPSLFGIGVRAGVSKPNMSAKDYLYESITNPDAHIVAGYEPNIMYTGYADELSKKNINDLISFLLTQ